MAYIRPLVRRGKLIAAARSALARDGVAATSLRAVAAEAGVALGTMQYVFPTKELLLRAVAEDIADEMVELFKSLAEVDRGLEHAISTWLTNFWNQLADAHGERQLHYELTVHSLRTAGQEELARWQYERYADAVAEWCQVAANNAGETCPVPFGQLARLIVAGTDGLMFQHVCDPNRDRSQETLNLLIETATILTRASRAT